MWYGRGSDDGAKEAGLSFRAIDAVVQGLRLQCAVLAIIVSSILLDWTVILQERLVELQSSQRRYRCRYHRVRIL